jgi:hypothetical protein
MTFDAGAIQARLILDRRQFQSDLAAAKNEGQAFERNSFNADLGFNVDVAKTTLADMQRLVDTFRKDVAAPEPLSLNPAEAKAAIAGVKQDLDQLRSEVEAPDDLNLNTTEADAKLRETRQLYEQLRQTLARTLNIDTKTTSETTDTSSGETKAPEATPAEAAPTSEAAVPNFGENLKSVTDANELLTTYIEKLHEASSSALELGLKDTIATNLVKFFTTELVDSADEAEHATGVYSLLTKNVTLWGGALGHIPLLGEAPAWHIALDGLLEATIALVSAGLALTAGFIAMEPAAHDIFNHLLAVHDVNNALNSDIPPLTGHLHDLQQQMAPGTVEAFGGALNLVNTQGGVFNVVAGQVVGGIDAWIAKLDVWSSAQEHSGALLTNGVIYLHQFEGVVDSLGQSLDNIAKADPGTAHYLLDLVGAGAKLLEIVTSLPQPILYTIVALHSFALWGGLVATGVDKVTTSVLGGVQAVGRFAAGFGAFGESGKLALAETQIPLADLRTNVEAVGEESKKTGGILGALGSGNLWAWAAVGAVAIAGVAYWMTQADSDTKKFVSTMNESLGSLSASQAITGINVDIEQLNNKIAQVPGHVAEMNSSFDKSEDTLRGGLEKTFKSLNDYSDPSKWGSAAVNWFVGLGGAAKGFWDTTTRAFGATHAELSKSADINAYKGSIIDLTKEQSNLFGETAHLMQQGNSYSQSLALMDIAGVKASDSFAVMKQKVDNLITGYQNMSVRGGILRSGVDAITLSTELQSSNISKLTGAWDTFLTLVTSGDTAFIGFEQGIATLDADSKKAGASMTGLSGASLTLRNDFQTSLTAAGKQYDALAGLASAAGLGARGTKLLSQAGKDLVAQLIPQAAHSKEATAELYAFAQIAGYNGPDSLKALTKWLGNTKGAEQSLDKIQSTLTVSAAGLTQDMKNLANALSGTLNTAMAAAIVQAGGGQKAFDKFATVVKNQPGNLSAMRGAASGLARQLITTLGNTKDAQKEFEVFSVKLGLSKSQADALWTSVVSGAQKMNSTHSARAGLNADIQGLLNRAPNARNDIDKLKTAVQQHGATAQTYAPERRKLIQDLEDSGVKAKTATGLVDGLIKQIGKIPAQKTANIKVQGSGSWSVTQQSSFVTGGKSTPIFDLPGRKEGWRVPGYGGGDKWPALLEGGETVVPKYLTPAVAPLMKAHGVPGFDSGTFVGGNYNGSVYPGMAGWDTTEYNKTTTAIEKAVAMAVKGGLAEMTSFMGVSGNVSSYAPVIASVLSALHQPAADVGPVEHRISQESGGNRTIVNKWDSNWAAGTPSVGLMQVIGPTFASNAGPYRDVGPFLYGVSTDPAANIYAGVHHAIYDYPGRSLASVMLQSGGYDNGGWVTPGITMVDNATRKNEMMLDPDMSDAFMKAVNNGSFSSGQAPLIGEYHTNYYGSGDTAQALNEMLFTLRRVRLGATSG